MMLTENIFAVKDIKNMIRRKNFMFVVVKKI